MQRSVRSVANAALLLRESCKRRLDWTAHSMGCYLLLLALRDATKPFSRVTLLAPDVPTWFFVDSLKRGVRENVRFLHCFHSRDEAVEISRQRRGCLLASRRCVFMGVWVMQKNIMLRDI